MNGRMHKRKENESLSFSFLGTTIQPAKKRILMAKNNSETKPNTAIKAKGTELKTEIKSPFSPFKPHKAKSKSTMEYGTYYELPIKLPFAKKERMLRVWLPPEYETYKDARFPVIYFSDGQNLVDKELSAYGDWHLDRVVHSLTEEGLVPPILVGLDCPKVPMERSNELNPPYEVKKSVRKHGPNAPIGDQYVDFMADEIKPLIDKTFRTNPSKEYTGLGGSSMGGIMSFYGFFYRKDVFGFALSFSIPVFFYEKSDWILLLQSLGDDPASVGKLSIFVGGKDFEKMFTKGNIWLTKYLRSLGFGEDKLLFMLDTKLPHHEESWYTYSADALRFWLKDLSIK